MITIFINSFLLSLIRNSIFFARHVKTYSCYTTSTNTMLLCRRTILQQRPLGASLLSSFRSSFSTDASSGIGCGSVPSELEEQYKDEIQQIHDDYAHRKKIKNSIVGIVVSTMCQKSVSVEYYHNRHFPKYQAVLPVRRKLMAHDEEEVCRVGDLIRVSPCRPMSKLKRHSVVDVIRKSTIVGVHGTEKRRKIRRFYPKKST